MESTWGRLAGWASSFAWGARSSSCCKRPPEGRRQGAGGDSQGLRGRALIAAVVWQGSSKARLQHLESLQAFVAAATKELMWLNEKEEEEVGYDWSEHNCHLVAKKESYSVWLGRAGRGGAGLRREAPAQGSSAPNLCLAGADARAGAAGAEGQGDPEHGRPAAARGAPRQSHGGGRGRGEGRGGGKGLPGLSAGRILPSCLWPLSHSPPPLELRGAAHTPPPPAPHPRSCPPPRPHGICV